jgi:hypothetical protein
MGVSLTHLLRFNDHGEDFLEQIITGDETWVHKYCPETSDSNHMMMSSMRCKHGCVVRIPTFYQQGFEKWISHLEECLKREGDYVEK